MAGILIKDLLPKPIDVAIGNGTSLSVRGITLKETIDLLTRYQDPLAAFFSNTKMDFRLLVAQAPRMVAEIIGMGVGAVGQEDDIERLPLQVQVEAVSAVWEQSVPNVEGLLASLARASSSLRVAKDMANIQPPSPTSSLNSSTASSVAITN